MRPIGFGCLDHNHPHEVVVAGRPVERDERTVGLLTLWRCPVLHTLGGYWHDLRRRPEVSAGTGPSLETLPG